MIALTCVLVLAVGGALLVGPQMLLLVLNYPRQSFAEDLPVPSPNYSEAASWALYGKTNGVEAPDTSTGQGQGPEVPNGSSPNARSVSVFFIHPTGYFRGEHWNSPLQPNSAASHNRRWMMANMASVFSDFAVYAPKYREATIYAFFDMEDEDGRAALDRAYHDVRAAFDAFIERNSGRPYILAGHSQGSLHGIRLLREIETGPYAQQLVAAYLAGGTQQSMTKDLLTPLCAGAGQTGCYVAWSTYGASYEASEEDLLDPFVCVNPISWQMNGSAQRVRHKGMLPEVGAVSFRVIGEDTVPFDALPSHAAPLAAYTGARCDQGLLRVRIPNPSDFKPFTPGDYHNYDYSLFHADVKANAHYRVQQYLAAQ